MALPLQDGEDGILESLEERLRHRVKVPLSAADQALTHTSDALSQAISAALPINPHRIPGYGGRGSDAMVAERRWHSLRRYFES